MRRFAALLAPLLALLALAGVASAHSGRLYAKPARDPGWLVAPQVAAGCPTAVDPARFASADELYRANARMAAFGERPTASRNHERFIGSIERSLRALPGVEVDKLAYPVNRWDLRKVSLRAGGKRIRVAGSVPYSKPGRVSAPLVYLPPDVPIEEADVRGKIVVRDTVTNVVPKAAFLALMWWSHDPDNELLLGTGGNYERENAGEARIHDMETAGKGGAAGVIFVHGFPHSQKRGQYAPYEGVVWPVPSVYLGADEGAQVKALAARGESARLVVDARTRRAETHMLVATLPGLSDEKIAVQSHTDGMNALWDNGPVAMVEMAEWFAKIGRECRPRTLQFAFTTGHLYQHLVHPDRDGSAEQFAKKIDEEYDNGKAALVVPMEHLGARGWDAVARGGGLPGRKLVPSRLNEPSSMFIGESPALIATALSTVRSHDLREAIALRGADLPGLQIPPHDNYGGEGNPYQHHLIPTVSLITGPWTLFDPSFSLEQLVDKELLHRQTLTFTDLVHNTSTMPRQVLGGGYVGYREARRLTCGTALEALALVRHCNGP